MGTRCGDIDPGLLPFLGDQGMSIKDIDNLMNKKSGLLGLSGHNDWRSVHEGALKGDEKCHLASGVCFLFCCAVLSVMQLRSWCITMQCCNESQLFLGSTLTRAGVFWVLMVASLLSTSVETQCQWIWNQSRSEGLVYIMFVFYITGVFQYAMHKASKEQQSFHPLFSTLTVLCIASVVQIPGGSMQVFVHRIRKYLGAYLLQLAGDCNAVVFSAGVGENAPEVRAAVCKNLEPWGIEIDEAANEAARGTAATISTPQSAIKVLVLPTDEEMCIARDAAQLAGMDIA